VSYPKLEPVELDKMDMPCTKAWDRVRKSDDQMRMLQHVMDVVQKHGMTSRQNMPSQEKEIQIAMGSSGLPSKMFTTLARDVAGLIAEKLGKETPGGAEDIKFLVISNIAGTGLRDYQANLAMMQQQFVSDIQNDPRIRSRFVIVAGDRERAIKALEAAGKGMSYKDLADPLTSSSQKGPITYPSEAIYRVDPALSVESPGKKGVTMQMSVGVWHPQTNSVVLNEIQACSYQFHPYREEWMGQEDDELLRVYGNWVEQENARRARENESRARQAEAQQKRGVSPAEMTFKMYQQQVPEAWAKGLLRGPEPQTDEWCQKMPVASAESRPALSSRN
jgi:hypothetical protein